MIVTVDLETYYTQEYSLRKMTTAEYILDPRFQLILMSAHVDGQKPEMLIGAREARQWAQTVDWSRVAGLAHNSKFDWSIMAWHFGVVPKLYLDTLSMGRATTHAVIGGSSLDKMSKYLQLPPKGNEVVRAIGKRLEDFTPVELQAYADYCSRDRENCRTIFDRLRHIFSPSELTLIDLVLRMHILPQVMLDSDALAAHLTELQHKKAEIMERVSAIDPAVFSSNQKFAALLESYGVEVPTKLSPTTGKETYALAKNDRAFRELCEDDSLPLEVQAILAARVRAKSTIDETRAETLLRLSGLGWTDGERGWAPVPLKYSGARTHRLSGDDGTNWQNFRRGSQIKAGVKAPPGMRVVHRDSSQIEARMVAWMARCEKLVSAFREKRDVYSEFASSVYGRLITKADVKERFVGKTGVLGLGYGCGPTKFRHMLFIGNGGISVKVDEETAKRIVYHYRNEYPEISDLWNGGDALLSQVLSASQRRQNVFVGGVAEMIAARWSHLPIKPGYDALWLPNGLCLSYPEIGWRLCPDGSRELTYSNGHGGWFKVYGAKVIENISQALSRIVVMDAAVRVYNSTGYNPFLSTHDSLDYCVPESEVEAFDNILEHEFAVPPDWALDLPLASEGGFGPTLLSAERAENV